MRLKRYCRRMRTQENGEDEYVLNLVPMLDMFLSLIPFLLVSAVFLNYGGLLVEAPSFAAQEQKQEVKPSEIPELDLAVKVTAEKITISAFTRGFLNKVESGNGSFDFNDRVGLETHLKTLKKSHRINSVLFHVDPNIAYQKAVTVLQSLRSTDLSSHVVLAVRNLP